MKIIGHRGSNFNDGENTLRAITKALTDAADGIEIDLRAVENSIIILHDETVNRTTDGCGHYKNFSLQSIRSLRCMNGDKIPLLQEILCLQKPIKELILEFKEPGIAGEVSQILDSHLQFSSGQYKKNIIVSSFNIEITKELSRYSDKWKLAILYKDDFFSAIERAKFYNALDVHVPMSDINEYNIKYAHKNKRRVYAFTVNNLKDYDLCLTCGVDGIFTDNPKYFGQRAAAEEQTR